jgi:tRNA G18 (ribose-2'-O)-methylase SpoU
MRKLTHVEISQRRATLETLQRAERLPVTVVVDNVRSLYNIGSIFRTSDGVLLKKLILTGYTPTPPRKEIDKTALGATRSVPWEYVKEPREAIRRAREAGIKTYCLEITDAAIPYHSVKPSDFPLSLVIGNEITGVSRDVIAECDAALEIPQLGIKQSLNVAVAYGIAIFELSRIWRADRAAPQEAIV